MYLAIWVSFPVELDTPLDATKRNIPDIIKLFIGSPSFDSHQGNGYAKVVFFLTSGYEYEVSIGDRGNHNALRLQP